MPTPTMAAAVAPTLFAVDPIPTCGKVVSRS
jgi:hypothetical protein